MLGMTEQIGKSIGCSLGKTIENSLSKSIESTLAKFNPLTQTTPHQMTGDTAFEQSQNTHPPELLREAEGLALDRGGWESDGNSQTRERDLTMIWNTLNALGLVRDETVVVQSPESVPKRDQTMSQASKNSVMPQPKSGTTNVGRPAVGQKRDQQQIGQTVPPQKRPKVQATAQEGKGQGHGKDATCGQKSRDASHPNQTTSHASHLTQTSDHQKGKTSHPIPPPTSVNGRVPTTPQDSSHTSNTETNRNNITDNNENSFNNSDIEDDNQENKWEEYEEYYEEEGEEFYPTEDNDNTSSPPGEVDGNTVPNVDNNNNKRSSDGDTVFKRMLELVVRLFPQARPITSKPPPPQCLHENNYSEVRNRDELSRLRLYDRVSEIRSDVTGRVAQVMGEGKGPSSLLPLKRKSFRVAEDDSFHRPPVMNVEVERIAGKTIPIREDLTLPSDDVRRIETALITLQENQSFTLWLISSLFNLLHEEGYTSSDPEVLRKISSTLSLAVVNQSTVTHELSSYLVAQRRETHFTNNETIVVIKVTYDYENYFINRLLI